MTTRSTTRKANQKAEHFLWHFDQPFSENGPLEFQRGFWWRKQKNLVSAGSALYEILRRHPLNAKIHLTSWPEDGNCTELAFFLWHYGLLAWNQLDNHNRQYFVREILPNTNLGKGQNFGTGLFNVTSQSIDVFGSRVAPAAVADKNVRENEVLRLTQAHHRSGRLIIAVDIDFGSCDDVFQYFKECYLQHWRPPKTIKRSHPDKWLTAIENFEKSEIGRPKILVRDKALFRSFKSLFSGIPLTLFRRKMLRKSPGNYVPLDSIAG